MKLCATCHRIAPAHRHTTAQHGYGGAHQRMRAALAPDVAAGLVRCARCHDRITPGQAWDLGHTDDRKAYSGAEHASCNRAAKPAVRKVAILW